MYLKIVERNLNGLSIKKKIIAVYGYGYTAYPAVTIQCLHNQNVTGDFKDVYKGYV